MRETSDGFRGDYSFLSNFTYFEKPLVIQRGKYRFVFKTTEHFYQACKFTDYNRILEISNHPSKGLKKYVNNLKHEWRSDWDDIKVGVMKTGLKYKFSDNNPQLRKKLVDTTLTELVEYNWWSDKFWGVCLKTGEGENTLGKLLMDIRKQL